MAMVLPGYTTLLYVSAVAPLVVQGQSYSDTDSLLTNLLAGYNTRVRPLDDQSRTVTVNFSISVYQFTDIDVIKGRISLGMLSFNRWYDERITWNPADYGGLNYVLIPVKYVWTPNVACGSPVTKMDVVGDDWMNVRYFSNGYASYSPGDIIDSSCKFDVSHWPFDRQTCNVTFLTFGYLESEVSLNVVSGNVFSDNYIEHGEWKLLGSDAVKEKEPITGMEYVNIRINLERRCEFYVMNIVLPVVGIMLLNPMVFLLPCESGERIGYSITVLLSIAVFFTIISDNLPTSSAPMAKIIIYNLIGLGCSMVISLTVILNQRLYYCNDCKPVPNWAATIVTFTKRKHCEKKVNAEADQNGEEKHNKSDTVKHGRVVYEQTKTPQTVYVRNTTTMVSEIGWKDVSVAVDKLFFCIFCLITVTVTVSFLVSLTTAN